MSSIFQKAEVEGLCPLQMHNSVASSVNPLEELLEIPDSFIHNVRAVQFDNHQSTECGKYGANKQLEARLSTTNSSTYVGGWEFPAFLPMFGLFTDCDEIL